MLNTSALSWHKMLLQVLAQYVFKSAQLSMLQNDVHDHCLFLFAPFEVDFSFPGTSWFNFLALAVTHCSSSCMPYLHIIPTVCLRGIGD